MKSRALHILGDLMSKPVGWLATGLLYLVSTPIYHYFAQATASATYTQFTIANELLGIVVFAAFIFPMLRIMLRDHFEIEPPRLWAWLGISVVTSILRYVLGMALIVAAIMSWPDVYIYIPLQWQEFVATSLVSPLFLGIFFWETGLVCGRHGPSFARCHSYLLGKRKRFVLGYAAIVIMDLASSIWLAGQIEDWPEWAVSALLNVPYALGSWLLSLIAVALYLELVEMPGSVSETFA